MGLGAGGIILKWHTLINAYLENNGQGCWCMAGKSGKALANSARQRTSWAAEVGRKAGAVVREGQGRLLGWGKC